VKKLQEIVDTVGTTSFDIANWMRKIQLSTEYMEVERRSPRLYSRENVLELTFLAALVKCGMSPAAAANYAYEFVQSINRPKNRKHSKFENWMVFPSGEHPVVEIGDRAELAFVPSVTQAIIIERSKRSKTFGVSVINTGEILRRVDKLFAEG
jgi:hypothetical protein